MIIIRESESLFWHMQEIILHLAIAVFVIQQCKTVNTWFKTEFDGHSAICDIILCKLFIQECLFFLKCVVIFEYPDSQLSLIRPYPGNCNLYILPF